VPDLDERTLETWARTDAIFWPAVAALLGSGALLAWTLRSMRRATRYAALRARHSTRVTSDDRDRRAG
jgi:hypothetical protein